MHLKCSTLIQKQAFENILSFAVDMTFSVLLFQIFTGISVLKIKNFEASYLYKKLSYTNIFLIMKLTCFKVLYNMF